MHRNAPTAQAEYAAIRAATGTSRGWIGSRRLVILPDRFMRKCGGAAVIYRWTCIGPKLLDAPPAVRRAILAHEWGHVVEGHSLATCASLVLLLVYIISASITVANNPFVLPFITMFALLLMGWCVLWVRKPEREHEADSVAMRIVGPADLAAAMRWASHNIYGGCAPDMLAQRLERLDKAARAMK